MVICTRYTKLKSAVVFGGGVHREVIIAEWVGDNILFTFRVIFVISVEIYLFYRNIIALICL